MISLWKGSCNQWDCDEMGHMNVRVYVEKQIEGLATMAHALKMPQAFRPGATSTLIPVDQHIRYMAEVLAGRPISMVGCVLDAGECDAVIYQEMRHTDGRVAAAFRTRVIHADNKSGEPFPWSSRSVDALETLKDTPPEHTAPRSVDMSTPTRDNSDVTYDHLKRHNIPLIGQGSVPPQHMDAHGRMAASWVIGRTSDSVPNLLYDWRQSMGKAEDGARRVGAAVLEYRMRYRHWPKTGDLFEAYTGGGTVGGKTHSLVHWMMDPVTGKPWATSEAVAITLDLDARKVIAAPPSMLDELKVIAPPGLSV
ncbi:MAG: thioesterase family protein [Hyphomonas sp.]